MESIKISDLIQCISQYLMRELHEISKTQKKSVLPEYCNKTRSLLKRVKKVLSWLRVYSSIPEKELELDYYTSARLLIYKDMSNLLSSLHSQQKYSLRTPLFAINEAADVMCRGEYYGFPSIGHRATNKKIPLEKFTRLVRHKALLSEIPIGVQIKISDGKLQVLREEHSITLTLSSNLNWRVVDFIVKHQDLTIFQKEQIYTEITEAISKCAESQVFVTCDLYLKKTSHQALLDIMYKQCKSIKEIQVNYIKNKYLQIVFWPNYPSSLILNIGNEGIEVDTIPKLNTQIDFYNDISVMLNNAITQHRIRRLASIDIEGIINDRLEVNAKSAYFIEIDVSYFTGEFVLYLMGKIDTGLSELLKTKSGPEVWLEIEKKILLLEIESICRTLGKNLVQEPLRFCRSFYSLGPCYKKPAIGYIDLGSILPTDSMGHIIVFCLRITNPPIASELVGYNEIEEEYCINISNLESQSLKEFVKQSLSKAREKIILLRIPIMLLAKPRV